MNAVENIESLVKRYFNEDIRIKDKSVTNNCIGALISKDNFKEFKKNFEDRLERLVGKITEKSQRKEVIEKIKNLAEKNDRKWDKTKNGSDYVFNIGYTGTLLTMYSNNPYELAEKDKYKYLNYYSKLLDIDYSVLTFVVNPWFNRQITNFCDFNRVYYRSVSRRVFMEFKNDATPAALYFRDIKNKAITVSDISTNIAGLLFIEDKSVKRDTDGILYKAYLYLNPNYANKKPLTVYDFSSAFEHSPISKMFEIDDFQHDNY